MANSYQNIPVPTPTQNPIPSADIRDHVFAGSKLDEFVTSMGWTYTDRFGGKHYTIEGLRWLAQQAISQYGYITLDSFETGNTITLPNQVLRLETTGEYYRWDGALPKEVPAGSTPESTGGVGTGAWIGVGDASLRHDLNPESFTGQNIAQLVASRKSALSSNTVRFCTWNIQGYYIVANENSPEAGDTVDTSRFNRDVASLQRIREQVEWFLRIGADFVGMQEVYMGMDCKLPGKTINSVGSIWGLYPYRGSFMSFDSWSADMVLQNPGGNLSLATRPLVNGTESLMETSTSGMAFRAVSRVEMVVNGVTIAIYNTHTDTGTPTIANQISHIASLIDTDTSTHIVLMGDWNNNDDSVYQPFIDRGFTMVNKNGELGTYNGGHTEWGQWYLDRIFHRGFSSQGDYGVLTPPRELGDHKPLWVDLTI
ncbi:endonuclease/exonuclease/phosphatase family protein [Citrobacter koseri]|uniref:tail fiber/spike domain-containing protein n=1 Tax=Citrobacter koseri TaxID=545 RepID=UPI0040390B69